MLELLLVTCLPYSWQKMNIPALLPSCFATTSKMQAWGQIWKQWSWRIMVGWSALGKTCINPTLVVMPRWKEVKLTWSSTSSVVFPFPYMRLSPVPCALYQHSSQPPFLLDNPFSFGSYSTSFLLCASSPPCPTHFLLILPHCTWT